jgi:hypothetical protein
MAVIGEHKEESVLELGFFFFQHPFDVFVSGGDL